ncbi:Pimeloyl-ACP methyl ester carboxylesterase [Cognatiyoonia koreensis]|uniref:Pimeloyl-ACP methyl ester carboxylesterase n=1 Tax=Cognatiyoonia koreensis TaxID=364200 RepID=A0A1I0MXB1_9RHOB|nr:alpha/beta hydrolase [Cognatiyoonia koreensis]SEV93042.1 Pimeloyl-ACP methyl ester carboxylesterase [Cognatiyoonia koreensis]
MLQTVAGHDVWVVSHEQGPAPDLLIHCSLADHRSLLPLVNARAQPACLFDMPGHGKSADWSGSGDFQTVCAEIGGALCTDGPAHIIGHSFGATVALRMAVMWPARVKALSLIEPVFFAAAAGTPAYAAHEADFAPFTAAMDRGDVMTAAAIFHGLWGQGAWSDLPAPVKSHLAARIHLIPAGAGAIQDDNAKLLSPGVLEGIKVPATLIRGDKSPSVIAAIHAELVARLPHASDRVVKGAGHMLPLTHVPEVARIMAKA